VLPFIEEMLSGTPLKKALGIATLNALSMNCWKQWPPKNYSIKVGMDAMDEVALPGDGYVVVMGAIVPTLRASSGAAGPLASSSCPPRFCDLMRCHTIFLPNMRRKSSRKRSCSS
jgi:hypothetical protein